MSQPSEFTVGPADWARHETELYAVRYRVFVIEQQVPVELERDEFDPLSLHVVARDAAGNAIGTGRLLPDGHIGRLAVLAQWRGHGVGVALMDALLVLARERGDAEVVLNAQTSAIAFYERLGFRTEGEDFMEAGIPHRVMRLRLGSG
jgi:predicted GNAT family N-acyltransferase